jgi:hypothetical protein
MVDTSHGPLLRVDEIKRQLDLLSRSKVNQYPWICSGFSSLKVNPEMLDYAGMKFLAAAELTDRWKELGPAINKETWWSTCAAEWE